MAKNSPLPKTEAPEEIRPTAELSKARADAINTLLREGWKDAEGKTRSVQSAQHAEFLARSGTIPPLPA